MLADFTNPILSYLPPGMMVLLVVWLTALGGCIGSFMNVVIYRVPAGLSVVHPRSRCPKCGHEIRWHDNIPVLGWLLLRGKCRDCRTPISARYPAVEALVAGVFLAVAWAELFSGGRNLPISPAERLPLTFNELASSYALHVGLLCTLICAAYIEFDGNRSPLKLFVPATVLVLAAITVFPDVLPLPWRAGSRSTSLIDGLIGMVVGGSIAQTNRRANAAAMALVGGALGWQAAAVVLAVAALAYVVGRRLNRRLPLLGCVAAAALALVIGWRTLDAALPTLVTQADWRLLIGSWAVVIASGWASPANREPRALAPGVRRKTRG